MNTPIVGTFADDCIKERGRVLNGKFAHYCNDWDGLTVDETCMEAASCNCSVVYNDDLVYTRHDFADEIAKVVAEFEASDPLRA